MSRDFKDFTIEEANALVPWLEYQFGMMFKHMREMEGLLAGLMGQGVDPSPQIASISRSDPLPVKRMKRRLRRLVSRIFDSYTKIQERGAVIQDVSEGTVSFYTYFGEHPAFLTWQIGEAEVRWWHELYEDADSRKPLPRNAAASVIVN